MWVSEARTAKAKAGAWGTAVLAAVRVCGSPERESGAARLCVRASVPCVRVRVEVAYIGVGSCLASYSGLGREDLGVGGLTCVVRVLPVTHGFDPH